MSDEHQPEAVWVFPEKKSNKGRIWLIVGLAVLAVVIVGVLLFFLLPRDSEPVPTPSPTDSAAATPSPSPTVTQTPVPTEAPVEESTPPPVPDPDLSTFTGQVQPWLDDAVTGLGFVADMNGQEAVQVIDSLQQDAERLSDAAAPSSIASEWQSAVAEYASKLSAVRGAFEDGAAPQSAIDGATASLQELRDLVGL